VALFFQYVYCLVFYVIMNSIQRMHLDYIYYTKLKSPTCFGLYRPSSRREVIEYKNRFTVIYSESRLWAVRTLKCHSVQTDENVALYESVAGMRQDCLAERTKARGCWHCKIQSPREHEWLSLFSVVCCQLQFFVTGRSLVQRNSTVYGCVCVCVI
jgi:hypothetical protein